MASSNISQKTESHLKYPLVKFNTNLLKSADPSTPNEYNLSYKINQGNQKLLKSILTKHGFKEIHNDSQYFTLLWLGSQILVSNLQGFTPYQKVNHFPRTTELTRKDKLVRNIQRMQQISMLARKKFDFIPKTFLIPGEFQEFERAFRREKGVWIVKPVGLSRGRGIILINHPNQVPISEAVIVSKYIPNPLLVDGFKFDLRLYIAVTSFDPLVIYFYEEGLARFATVKYNKNQQKIKDLCMHLTNYSINRLSSHYIRCEDPDVDDYGNKWSLSALLKKLSSLGYNIKDLIAKIEDIIIKTIISAEIPIAQACRTFVPFQGNCFELYGFDILIDENMKPWLLEVNMSPSLACDAPIDIKIKSQLIVDLLNLIGIACFDPVLDKKQQQMKTTSNIRNLWHLHPKNNQKSKISSGNHKLTNEEQKMVSFFQEENNRTGAFVRIFPGEDTWQLYNQFIEDKSGYNRLLHDQIFQPSLPLHPNSRNLLPQSTLINSKSLNSIVDLDADSKNVRLPPSTLSKSSSKSQSICCISNNDENMQQKSNREFILASLNENNLSGKQIRLTFTHYLKKIKERHLGYVDDKKTSLTSDKKKQILQQADLILKFLAKAATNMTVKFNGKQANTDLPFQERIDHSIKVLEEFLKCYSKECKIQNEFDILRPGNKENCLESSVFDSFIAIATEEDLEHVLTLSTKSNKLSGPVNTSSLFMNKMKLLPRKSTWSNIFKKESG